MEAAAHVRVQAEIDGLLAAVALPPDQRNSSSGSIASFVMMAPRNMLAIQFGERQFIMEPGAWRYSTEHDVAAGRHVPPSSQRVADVMQHFESRFRFDRMGKAAQIMAIASPHHRFNYIHPFPDGNGRVSRLMSHATAGVAGIGAHGLWSMSRSMARSIDSRGEYKRMMDHADMPRQGDRDGLGNLSEAALKHFILWFLPVFLDQTTFMSELFDLDNLVRRLRHCVERHPTLKSEAARLLEEALFRGEFERGEIERVTGLPERSARRVLADLLDLGLLGSDTP